MEVGKRRKEEKEREKQNDGNPKSSLRKLFFFQNYRAFCTRRADRD